MVSGLEVDQVSVRFGPVTAADQVSLQVAPGEVVALLGPSGSGKSSLLRAIAGLEPLAAGQVRWNGVDLADTPVHRRGFVMMFQDGQLFPHLSVAGNVGYALTTPPAKRTRQVEDLLELVGLPGYGSRPVTALSGGEAQRVALARSLAAEPRLLLLDEPLSALDEGLREHLAQVLDATLRATGTPALHVTHDQDEAFALADRVGVMDAGRLRQIGTPAQVWAHPIDPAVAEFLGYGPFLNFSQARTLGWVTPFEGRLGVGPTGLMLDSYGTEVEVLRSRPRRGGSELTVRLQDGTATVVVPSILGHDQAITQVRVRLDPAGCALVGPE